MAIRNPTPAQLEIYHRFQPRDTEPVAAEELAVVEFIAADNLLNRSRSRWHPTALPELADLVAGKNLMLDHDWENVAKNQALNLNAWLITEPTAPIDLVEACGNGRYNREIIAREGYQTIHFDAAMPIGSSLLDALRYCQVQFISQGGFAFKDIWCPICDCSYYDEDCPHLLPSWYEDDPKLTMPYYERKDVIDLGEISIVTIPNLPGARVISA